MFVRGGMKLYYCHCVLHLKIYFINGSLKLSEAADFRI